MKSQWLKRLTIASWALFLASLGVRLVPGICNAWDCSPVQRRVAGFGEYSLGRIVFYCDTYHAGPGTLLPMACGFHLESRRVYCMPGIRYLYSPTRTFYRERSAAMDISLWPITLASALLLALAIVRATKIKRAPAGSCKCCGYDLRASPERCPECGAVPVTEKE